MIKRKIFISTISGVLAAAVLLSTSLYEQVSAATTSEIQQQIDELEDKEAQLQEKLDALEEQISSNASETEEIVRQKNLIDEQITLLHEQMENTNTQITAFGVLIADKQVELEEAQARLEELREKHKERIRAMEEQGELSYWTVLFRASSFSELLDRINMIRQIAAADQCRLDELEEAARQVETVQEELESQKTALELTKEEQEKDRQTLEEKRTQADGLLQELIAKGAEFETLLEQSEEEQAQLMEQLAQKENEYDEAAYQEWLATSVPEPESPDIEAPVSSSDWLTPVPYYTLTSPFGMRLHPELHIWRMHNGVDMACATDTPIYASRSGYVTVTDYQEYGAGNYVQLDHGDGYRSIYMHMTRYIVSAGQYVSAGQVIGYVGSTGLSSGPHLHFGISYNGTYVNPMEYVG